MAVDPERDEMLLRMFERLGVAILPVQADLDRTFVRSVTVGVDFGDFDRLIITVEGQSTSTDAGPNDGAAEMAAMVADEAREVLVDQTGERFWPTCGAHGRGLHATVEGGVAVWTCSVGPHVVANIGELDASDLG